MKLITHPHNTQLIGAPLWEPFSKAPLCFLVAYSFYKISLASDHLAILL